MYANNQDFSISSTIKLALVHSRVLILPVIQQLVTLKGSNQCVGQSYSTQLNSKKKVDPAISLFYIQVSPIDSSLTRRRMITTTATCFEHFINIYLAFFLVSFVHLSTDRLQQTYVQRHTCSYNFTGFLSIQTGKSFISFQKFAFLVPCCFCKVVMLTKKVESWSQFLQLKIHRIENLVATVENLKNN